MYDGCMRTTVTIDPDIEAELERLRRDEGLGLSEALNTLARRGLVAAPRAKPFRQRTTKLGLRVDVTDIGEVLDMLDEPEQRVR